MFREISPTPLSGKLRLTSAFGSPRTLLMRNQVNCECKSRLPVVNSKIPVTGITYHGHVRRPRSNDHLAALIFLRNVCCHFTDFVYMLTIGLRYSKYGNRVLSIQRKSTLSYCALSILLQAILVPYLFFLILTVSL